LGEGGAIIAPPCRAVRPERVGTPPSTRRLLDEVNAFRYVTVPNAATYRAAMQVCYEALQRYVIELRPDQILSALREGGFVVEIDDVEALESQVLGPLREWGNLAVAADPAGVDRLEDFYRRRLVYHVTDVGEAAHRAVLEVEATIGKSGSLQTNMLIKIRDALPALARAAGAADQELLLRLLHEVEAAFQTLTHEANRFMTDLGRLVSEEQGEASETRFVAFKQAVLSYIGRFVEELRRLHDEIVEGIRAVELAGIDAIVETAARSADLPDFANDGSVRARWATERRERWRGVGAWFIGDGAEEPTVERLAQFAIGAVLSLTRTLGRLNDRRGRPVDRTTDFLTLARWFAECESEAKAHELFHVAFGLQGARHLYLAEEDPEAGSTRASWWVAKPVTVPTRLRTHGRVPTQGRSHRAADYSKERAWLAARVQRERAQVEAAVTRFTGTSFRLSTLATLDAVEFDLLLDLLDAALAAPADSGGSRSTRTADGRLEIVLECPSDGAACTIITPAGRLRAPDYLVRVTDLATTSRRQPMLPLSQAAV
jgi:uncharacterized protein (TIGR02677 family)